MSDPLDLGSRSTGDLLRLYASVLDELLRRGVVRTRNAPAGDYAEWLVARATGGTLEPNSNPSWDVTAPDGTHLQVKCRVVGPATRKSANYSVFRSWNFDRCVFITLDQATYDVVRAVSVPSEVVRHRARASAHVNGHRITLGVDLLALDSAEDITDAIRAAAGEGTAGPPQQPHNVQHEPSMNQEPSGFTSSSASEYMFHPS